MQKPLKIIGVLLVLLLLAMFLFAQGKRPFQTSDFVGKWKSSKITTPIYLHDNGEWEIKTDDGGVLQHGVWRYADKKLIWTVRLSGGILHDVNPVLSVGSVEFQISEKDGSLTTFKRLFD